MTSVISYRESFDKDGTHYTQRIRISKDVLKTLASAIDEEIFLRFPNRNKYFASYPELFLRPLDLSKSIIYLTITQNNFIKHILGNKRIHTYHNTYLVIDNK